MVSRDAYERMLQQMQVPEGFVVKRGNACFVKAGSSEIELEEYLHQCSFEAQCCRDEIEFFIEQADFSFEGLHNAGGKKDQKNKELENKLLSLVNRMTVASDLRELDSLYQQVRRLIEKMHVGILDNRARDRVFDELDRRKDHYDFLPNGKTRYYHTEELASGLDIDMVKNCISGGLVDPLLIKAYVETIYSSQKLRIVVDQQSKSARPHYFYEEEVLDDDALVDDTPTISDEELQNYRSDLIRQRGELIDRRSRAQLKLDELLKEKRELEASATINGLFERETYEVPVYREHPNAVDGDVVGYEEKSRFKNGTDSQREQYRTSLRLVEQRIRKVEEEIEVLSENINSISAKIGEFAVEDTPVRKPEARIFGLAKLKQALSRIVSKRSSREDVEELLDEEEEIMDDDYVAGRRY